jgi:hypothetical protein
MLPHSVTRVPVIQVAHLVSFIHRGVVKRFENGSHNDGRANDANKTKNGDVIASEVESFGHDD